MHYHPAFLVIRNGNEIIVREGDTKEQPVEVRTCPPLRLARNRYTRARIRRFHAAFDLKTIP